MDQCLVCEQPIEQRAGGHRKREYCGDTCRQRGRRQRQGATDGGPRNLKRSEQITALENEVQRLQERLNIEERFRTDTSVRHFKKWLRTHEQPQDTDFFKRFLADSRLPEHASRGLYEAKMRSAGTYSQEDVYFFQETWKTMLAEGLK